MSPEEMKRRAAESLVIADKIKDAIPKGVQVRDVCCALTAMLARFQMHLRDVPADAQDALAHVLVPAIKQTIDDAIAFYVAMLKVNTPGADAAAIIKAGHAIPLPTPEEMLATIVGLDKLSAPTARESANKPSSN